MNTTRDIIRVFPKITKWTPKDAIAFVGEPPLPGFRPSNRNTPVLVSCTFSWDRRIAAMLADSWSRFYSDVRLGGPAFGAYGHEFIAGRFIKQGVTITSRGCPRRCPWCYAWRREGALRTLPIVPGNIVQDNNLLACPKHHIEAVFDMLKGQRAVKFSGGLDARLFTDWHRNLIEEIRFDELWFACDTPDSFYDLQRVSKILDGISIEKRRCYVLIGFRGESIDEAQTLLEHVYELGFLPFAQLYRSETAMRYPKKWKDLARKWSRPAAYRSAGRSTMKQNTGSQEV